MSLMLKKYKFTIFHLLRDKVPNALRLHFIFAWCKCQWEHEQLHIVVFFTEADMKEKILIIEDDPLIRNELKTLMQSNGYETVAPEDFLMWSTGSKLNNHTWFCWTSSCRESAAFLSAPRFAHFPKYQSSLWQAATRIWTNWTASCWVEMLLSRSPITQQSCLRKLLLCWKSLSHTATGTDRLWRCSAAYGIQQFRL